MKSGTDHIASITSEMDTEPMACDIEKTQVIKNLLPMGNIPENERQLRMKDLQMHGMPAPIIVDLDEDCPF